MGASELVRLAGCFFLLCSVLGLGIGLEDGWLESDRSLWPKVRAVIENSGVQHEEDEAVWVLRCGLRYDAESRLWRSLVESRESRSLADLAKMQAWVAEHPVGANLDIRYDPDNPGRAAFAVEDFPRAGPRSLDDARTVLASTLIGLGLLGLAAVLRGQQM